MKKFLLYGHGGSFNHGSEASVKCDISLLRRVFPDCHITLSTHFPEQDIKFNIDADEIIGRNINGDTYEEIYADTIKCITSDMICLSVGGDIYCYPGWQRYATIHNAALNVGAKSVLWSCSIEPSMIDNEMLEVLKSHTIITVRESVTYNELRKRGLSNVILVSDIAFLLDPQKNEIPKTEYVVINLSPLVLRKNSDLLLCFQNLVNEIISNTELDVVLLPHVEVSVDNDIDALNLLNGPKERIYRIPTGLSAAEYKYIISNAKFCVAARTHVTIAAWSSIVPTIAVGYSTKAVGIATDLNQQDLVVDVDSINADVLCEKFFYMMKKESEIKSVLKKSVLKCKGFLKKNEEILNNL